MHTLSVSAIHNKMYYIFSEDKVFTCHVYLTTTTPYINFLRKDKHPQTEPEFTYLNNCFYPKMFPS